MKHHLLPACIAAAFVISASLCLSAEPALKKPSENKVYAQTLINEIARDNPDLLIATLHAVAPGASDQTMIAGTLDRIGEKDDDEDLTVVKEHEIILAPNLTDSKKFKAHMAMKDAAGRVIGELVLIFKNDPGKDEAYYGARAVDIRNRLAKKIPALDELFKPTS